MAKPPAEMLTEERMKRILSTKLVTLMRREHMTQSELSKRSGVLKQSVNAYVNGKQLPDATRLQKLADILKVTPEDLLPTVTGAQLAEMVREEAENPVPQHSLTAIPGRPGFSRLEVSVDLPTALAMRIMALMLNDETAAPAS